jgi:hypothetical protein
VNPEFNDSDSQASRYKFTTRSFTNQTTSNRPTGSKFRPLENSQKFPYDNETCLQRSSKTIQRQNEVSRKLYIVFRAARD